jgi:hypothetical protein
LKEYKTDITKNITKRESILKSPAHPQLLGLEKKKRSIHTAAKKPIWFRVIDQGVTEVGL